MTEEQRHELFDRYLKGELDGQELDAFLENLKSDEELEQEFQTYRLLVEGIRQHEKEELLAYMRKEARVRFMGNPFGKSWTIASAAVLLAFGVLYFTLGDLNEEVGSDPVATQSDLPKEDKPKKQAQQKEEQPEKPTESAIEEPAATEKIADNVPQAPAMQDVTESEEVDDIAYPEIDFREDQRVQASSDNEFPVKEDILLYDTSLVPVLKSSLGTEVKANPTQAADSAIKSQVKQKGLKVEESHPIRVEFWKSPINYQGYRFNGKRLQLFGTYDVLDIELLSYAKNSELKVYELYLRLGDVYYLLVEDTNYNKLKPVSDESLLEKLK